MGRTQPHGIAGHHGAARLPDFGCTLPMFHQPAGPAGQKPYSQAREGPHEAEKALPSRLLLNCGESTISVGRLLGLAQDFCGRGTQCGLASDPVAARDRVEGGHRGWWGV